MTTSPTPPPGKEDYVLVCRPYITLRNGTRLYAHEVGKKAFCWWAPPR